MTNSGIFVTFLSIKKGIIINKEIELFFTRIIIRIKNENADNLVKKVAVELELKKISVMLIHKHHYNSPFQRKANSYG